MWVQDIKGACYGYKIWGHLGWSDIQQRYRGSLLGPLWITLSMVIVVAALGIVYSRLFHQEINVFIPFLTCGILAWTYITSILTESSDVFTSAKDFIENIRMPYTTHVFKLVWRNILIFLHNLIVYVFVLFIFKVKMTVYTLLIIPGFLLVTLNLASLSIIIGILGARFRDLPPVINSLIMVAFFVSPVAWQPKLLGENSLIIKLNPFSYFLDLIRSPLLGSPPQISSFVFCVVLMIVTLLLASLVFSRYRSRIAFWI